jgi:hypothetical protein
MAREVQNRNEINCGVAKSLFEFDFLFASPA